MVHITLRGPPCPRHDGPAPVRPVVGLDERLEPRCAGRPQAPELWGMLGVRPRARPRRTLSHCSGRWRAREAVQPASGFS
jgi:hypothetical protein